MYRLIASKKFNKNLKKFLKKHPELGNLVSEKIKFLHQNPRNPKLETHKLSGTLKNRLGVSISHEYRLVISFSKNDIYLHTIGTHDDVY